MQKLTLSAAAFGLAFAVHPEAKFMTVDANGVVKAHYDNAKAVALAWYSATNGMSKQPDIIGRVQLGGENWKDCIAAVIPPAANDTPEPTGKTIILPPGERWRSMPAYTAQVAYRAEVAKVLKASGITVKLSSDRRARA